MEKTPKVLFLSKGKPTTSQIAEGFLLSMAANRLIVVSAGTQPGDSDPLATDVMKEAGIDIRGQQSKNVAQLLKEHFGYVVTLYDSSKERSPIFPFTFHLLQWSVMDPSAVWGSIAVRKQAFRRVRDEIRPRIQDLLREIVSEEQEHRVLAHVA